MGWRDGKPAYGDKPISRDIRENFAYLKTVTDTLLSNTVPGITLTGAEINASLRPELLPGYLQRPLFAYKSLTEIYINPGIYHHAGTVNQNVHWDSQLTFQFGSGGSNPDSLDLAGYGWYCVYIDDSAVVASGSNLLTAAQFVANTTVPVWNDAKHGLYNGNDRYIFAVKLYNNCIIQFYHAGDLCMFGDEQESRAMADLDNVFTDVTLELPPGATQAQVVFKVDAHGAAALNRLFWRTDGNAGSGHRALAIDYVTGGGSWVEATVTVIASMAGIIEIAFFSTGDHQAGVMTSGWYFPIGM